MELVFFIITLLGGWLFGAWVSRWRERRALPIWTWALAFALGWSWALWRAGAWAFNWTAWRGLVLVFVLAFPVGFMTCVVAAMTAGRGKSPRSEPS